MDATPAAPADASARPGSRPYDVAVVGAGIVGLAVARELQRRSPGRRIVVVDREDRVGAHQTSHSSGVIHAGIYYPPGSAKARNCVEGQRRMYAFCEEHGVAHERVGKLIVALTDAERPKLDELERRGHANGVAGLRRLEGLVAIREIEPHVVGVAALHSPNTGIADFGAVAATLARLLCEDGGELRLGFAVGAVRRTAEGVELVREGGGEAIAARRMVACAGLWSDRLAVAEGADPDPRIVPFRGAYLRLKPEAEHLVRSLIYPVPDPDLPFLGVHLTKHISGEVWLGPTALLVGARDAYRLRTVRARDVRETLAWPGTRKVVRRFWRTAGAEVRMAASRKAFARACAAYVPELRPEHVTDGPAGVRAQAVGRDGAMVDDFIVASGAGGRALHVRNAPSPAATSSLALAEQIADRAESELGV